MKERIQHFIDHKGISAGELASVLDVQRSNVSHILNGRNKPGAAFIEKFLLAYPDLNARWLLTGMGDMLNNNSDNNLSITSTKSPIKEELKNKASSSQLTEQKPEQSDLRQLISNAGKRVLKVILLFSDGTFTSYNSNN